MASGRMVIVMVTATLLAFPMMIPCATGDGMMMVYTNDPYDDWDLSAEETQYGMISYVNGEERFILAIKINSRSLEDAAGAVWMFAIPSPPESVEIDLMPTISEFNGESMSDLAREELCSNLILGYGTQLYPLLMAPFLGDGDSSGFSSGGDEMKGGLGDSSADFVEVSMHVEAQGLTMEVVSTEHAEALDLYLQERDMQLGSASLSLIEEYVGQDYCFVVSWISDVEEFLAKAVTQYDYSTGTRYLEIGLFTKFPTDRIFYPLRLTSIYGETVVPMLLQIVGHVEPDGAAFDYGKLDVKVEHKLDDSYYMSSDQVEFFDGLGLVIDANVGLIRDVEYTDVVIMAPSNQLEADLWMVPASSATLDANQWIIDNGFLAAAMIIVGISMLTGVVAGAVVFAGHKPILWRFGLLGLANVLTVVGLWIAAWKLEFERTMTRSEIALNGSQYRMDFVVVYTILFVSSITITLFMLL